MITGYSQGDQMTTAEAISQLREALKAVEEASEKEIALIRKHGFVFNRAPGDVSNPDMEDGERWEHLAFAFYSDIAALSDRAKQVLDDTEAISDSSQGGQ